MQLGLGMGLNKSSPVVPLIPTSLRPNALAVYTARPVGLSDYAVPITNAVTHGDFSDGLSTGWSGINGTLSVVNDTLLVTGNGTNANVRTQFATSMPYANGKKIGGVVQVRVTSAGCTGIVGQIKDASGGNAVGCVAQANPVQNQWYTLTGIGALTVDSTTVIAYIYHSYADAATANGKVMEIRTILYTDLSTPFGLSNEPTAAEFADMLVYAGVTYWNGARNVVINPNDKYYWPDRSGNNRHLHLVNVAYDATGGLQTAYPPNYLFDGVNDYAVFNSATDIVAANGAVSAFVVFQAKGTVQATHRVLYTANAGGATPMLRFYASPTGITGACDSSTVSISDVVVSNVWRSVYSGYDATTDLAEVATQGGAIVKSGISDAVTLATRNITLCAHSNLTGYSNTCVAEVYLFNKVLSQAEIKQLHNNIASRYSLSRV